MDLFYLLFPVSGVKTYIFVPPLVALAVSFFTSMGGVSGAFLLLPFQMSFLGFTSPSVSSTNFLYNIIAIPSGVYRFIREGRMAWPLTWVIILGTLPGILIGYYLRIHFLPNPRTFKFFVGCVLFYVGMRLLNEVRGKSSGQTAKINDLDVKFRERANQLQGNRDSWFSAGIPPEAVVRTVSFSLKKVEYEFWGNTFAFGTVPMFMLSFVVGIVGGTYGIGGGAIIAPFCVTAFNLPVYTVAGAALMGTFLTSVAGVLFYSILPASNGLATSPDWLLGFLFGIGGFIGMYLGARMQKYAPQRLIKLMLGSIIIYVSVRYVTQFF